MARFLVVLAVVAVAFTVYTLVDVLMTDRSRVRGLTKPIWVILVLLLPVVGGLLWLLIGKARRTSGGSRMIAPDDDPDFLGSINREDAARRAEHEERLRRLEQELADLDDDTRDDSAR
jgi:hypothetical protein